MTSERKPLNFLGYNLGSYIDWDSSDNHMVFFNWNPGPDVKVPILNQKGLDLFISIGLENGIVEVEAEEGDNSFTHSFTLLSRPWREFIGH
jgi:hypothetical protein